MKADDQLAGVYAAAVTPLNEDARPDLASIPGFLIFLADQGCHGALLMGTTGEGPSFARKERFSICEAASSVRRARPDFRLLAGTGTPSLSETIENCRDAFKAGFDGVVVLPPYYYRNAPDEGLFAWFDQVIDHAIPAGGRLFAYHIPQMSGVPISLDLIAHLMASHPRRFAGIKDSSGDAEWSKSLGAEFGQQLVILNGNDCLFSQALDHGASGCITALANLFAADLRRIWDERLAGRPELKAQERLCQAREILDRHPPAAPILKALVARRHSFPRWAVRPPLLPSAPAVEELVLTELENADL